MTEDTTAVRVTERHHKYAPSVSSLRSVLDTDTRKTLDLGWVNVYPNGKCSYWHPDKDRADEFADSERIACVRIPPIEYTPGEGL
jgi:hypothetical protein